MDFTGHIVGRSIDFDTRETLLTLKVDKDSSSEVPFTKEDKLSVHVTKWRKKRSLDANAYLWVLCSKIANVIHSSKEEVYEEMLNKYGVFYRDDEGYVVVTVKSNVDMKKIDGHWKFCGGSSDGKFHSYMMLKGSSSFDTKEMSDLLEGVISEAKELGIETESDQEHRAMLEEWGKQYEKAQGKEHRS